MECFLSHYLAKAPRAAPTNSSAANLWLVKFDEWRELKGSPKASPKPAVCAELQVMLTEAVELCLSRSLAMPLDQPCMPAGRTGPYLLGQVDWAWCHGMLLAIVSFGAILAGPFTS